MHIVRVQFEDRPVYAALDDDAGELLLRGPALDSEELGLVRVSADGVSGLPVVAPTKVIGIGLNYRDHALETGQPVPTAPVTFSVYPSSLLPDRHDILVPRSVTSFVDFEAELGVVIGRRAKAVSVEDALDHVFGYTCVNDVSARDAQVADGQWVRAKSFDTFTPVGPWLTSASDLPDPQSLAISCSVNGELVQQSSTSEMIFSVAELVSYLSQTATLLPGDLIMTGTPAGVGHAREPKLRLRDGDTVSVTIESIGTLTNRVREV